MATLENSKDEELEEQVDAYYEYLNEMSDCKDCEEIVDLCMKSLPLLEPLIKEMKREYRSFDITGIPAIEKGVPLIATYGDVAKLDVFKSVVEKSKEPEPWADVINDGYRMLDLKRCIEELVKSSSGYKQKDLKKALGEADGRLVSRLYIIWIKLEV